MNQAVLEARKFEHVRRQRIETLDVFINEYEHLKTGAKHFHFEADHTERAFMVALRTVPEDSSGVAHILEHTALCGSARYPVRDPFFSMLKRSLNTFMNAFTGSDYTAYPFASTNERDFYNLLDVYLDAVFFASLDPLDFAQEGHRVEFSDAKDLNSPLVFKGVVFNEMKGDMSSPRSVLWETLNRYLFPTATYHYNSGGDPVAITDLTHTALKAFYKAHYHPSNAIFMSFGNLEVSALHTLMDDRVLSHFEKQSTQIAVLPEQRWSGPVRVQEPYGIGGDEAESAKSHLMLAWLLGKSTDLKAMLEATLLADALLDTSASPLRRALEGFPGAQGVSPLCGLEESHFEMSFVCGLEGVSEPDIAAFEALVNGVLEEVAVKGIPKEQLKGVLHQMELAQREVGGDGMPYGLQLIFSCLPAAIHRGDPFKVLDLDRALKELGAEIERPEFVKELVQRLLLNNQHRVTLALVPDSDLDQRSSEFENQRLAALARGLSEADRLTVSAQADALEARQNQIEDLEILPKVSVADIPDDRDYASPSVVGPITAYGAGCNGIVYHQLLSELPSLDPQEWQLLPILNQSIGELGVYDRGYLEVQNQQQELSGGMNAFASVRADLEQPELTKAVHVLSSRALHRNADAMMQLLEDCRGGLRFDEHDRLKELIEQLTARKAMGVINQAHSYAMTAASACFAPVAALNHHITGLGSLEWYKRLGQRVQEGGLGEVAEQLSALHQRIKAAPRSALVISESERLEALSAMVPGQRDLRSPKDQLLEPFPLQPVARVAYLTSTQVNFCAAAYPCPTERDELSAATQVLAVVLRHQYLHPEIREKGGAYGGGASYDAASGVFRLYSYRDPALARTLDVFRGSEGFMAGHPLSEADVEEAILGIISSLDAPGSPAGAARGDFYQRLHGRSETFRRSQRQAILAVTSAEVKAVAADILARQSSLCVVTSHEAASELSADFDQVLL